MESNKRLPERILKVREACLSHADDLMRAARRLLNDENLPHIAYHLATLGLEEIGKSTLIIIVHSSKKRSSSVWNPERYLDDHIKKLFWAIWSPLLGRKKVTREQIEELQGLSKGIHFTRLSGIYVDFNDTGLNVPQHAIDRSQAENLISFVDSRLQIERSISLDRELADNDIKLLTWFLTATEDLTKRDMIMGSKSMEKLVELGSAGKWMAWLKKEFDEAHKISVELTKNELNRKIEVGDIGINKWKLKIRLYTNSHSIRPKSLKYWNNICNWIEILPVSNKRDQIIVEFTLPKSIRLDQLWIAGWTVVHKFIIALNIASCGCFWWYIPEHISRYYEKIIDLESKNTEVRIERNPILKLDWNRDALTEENFRQTAFSFAMFLRHDDDALNKSLQYYANALSFLNKSDIYLQFESNVYECFYTALKVAMEYFESTSQKINIEDIFKGLCDQINIDEEEQKKHLNFFQQFEQVPPSPSGITLSEVGVIKIVCDAYYLIKLKEIAKKMAIERNKK